MPAALRPIKVTVIVVNYNGGALLGRALAALTAQTMSDFAAVIVDNASTDGSLTDVPDDPRFTIVRNETNRGFAAGNNQIGLTATTEWLALLNPDAIPQPDWLAQLLAAADMHPNCDLFGSTQLRLDDPRIADGLGDALSVVGVPWRGGHGHRIAAPYPDGEVFGPCAAAALVRTSRFRQFGGFCEDFFCYCEDVDLAFRHRLAGGTARQVSAAIVHHSGSAISGVDSAFSLYHGIRNMIWLFWRGMPGPLLLLAPLNLLAALAIWAQKTRQHGRALPHRAIVRAIWDAYRGLPRVWHQRRTIQLSRTLTVAQTARLLAWNPLAVSRHDARVR